MFLKVILVIAIIGGIAGGIATEGQREEGIDTPFEKVIKLCAFFLVALALIAYWVLPNTRLAKSFKMNETLFILSNGAGIIFGIAGLIATILWQQLFTNSHLFEFIIVLFGCVYVYWAMIMKSKKTIEVSDILDEKQIGDMTRAAASSLSISTGIMLIMYLHNPIMLEGKLWFHFYFFIVLLIYSVSALYYFKKV